MQGGAGTRSYVMSWKVKALGGGFEHLRCVTIGSISDVEFGQGEEPRERI